LLVFCEYVCTEILINYNSQVSYNDNWGKKMKMKFVILCVLMLVITSFYGTVNAENNNINLSKNLGDQSLNRRVVKLGIANVMGNGNPEESYADVTCYNVDDIECCSGEEIIFWIDYNLDCWGAWDWAECYAIVNGELDYAETNGNLHDHFEFPIECECGETR